MEIRFIDFTENINLLPLTEHAAEDAVFVFPTYAAKKEALLQYQDKIAFPLDNLHTFAELTESIFKPTKPLLKEEKRLLLFYASLSAPAKEFFRISDYFSAIGFAQEFFALFEELNEEEITPAAFVDQLEATLDEIKAQKIYHLLQILKIYGDFLEQTPYSDAIFACTPDHYCLEANNKTIIIVNQFYFTEREKTIINSYKNAVVYLQMPATWYDEKKLKVKKITARERGKINLQSLKIATVPDLFNMQNTLGFWAMEASAVIDINGVTAKLLPGLTEKNSGTAIKNTSFFSIIAFLEKILGGIKQQGTKLYPLQAFYDFAFYCQQLKLLELSEPRFLSRLAADGYKFYDARLASVFPAELKDLQQLVCLAESCRCFADVETLSERILAKLPQAGYLNKIREALYDFLSLSYLPLNLNEIFVQNTAGSLLKLFLEYLKPKVIYEEKIAGLPIKTLLTSRNSIQKKPLFLDITQRVLPALPQPSLLLTEGQRKSLGLKTYEDVKMRDKYYFYRLLFCAREAIILTRKNQEEDIEPSSFLEELRLYLPPTLIKNDEELPEFSYSRFCKKFLAPCGEKREETVTAEFFTTKQDYRVWGEKLFLTPTAFANLQQDPLSYYLQHVLELSPRKEILPHDYTPAYIGNYVHKVMEELWENHNRRQPLTPSIFREVCQNNKEPLCSPHNYAQTFFEQIFLPLFEESFFQLLSVLAMKTSNRQPEAEKFFKADLPLFILEKIPVFAAGKADFYWKNGTTYLIDYKTGRKDTKYKNQLLHYALACGDDEDNFMLYLFYLHAEPPELCFPPHETKIRMEKHAQEIEKVLSRIVEEGFYVQRPLPGYEELIRYDLYRQLFSLTEEEEEDD